MQPNPGFIAVAATLAGKRYCAPALLVRMETSCAGQKAPHKQLRTGSQVRASRYYRYVN
jgi:hypothetical protein